MIWISVLLGLLLAAFGATAGAALVTVSRAELARAVSRRLRGTGASLAWLSRVDGWLAAASATTSLGVLLLGASLPAVLVNWAGVRSVVVLALVAVPFVLLSGYLLPRWLTQPRAETVAARILPVLRPWAAVVGTVLPARAPSRPHDLRSLWREGAAVGIAADEEFVMAGGVMTFSQRLVREAMTPRTDIVAISEDAPFEEILDVFAHSGYTRIPVYRGTLDEIIGMLHAFDLFKLHPGDPLPVRPVTATPGSRRCGDLLLDMQRERRHLAVVLDEFGGTAGIITLEDLLEELVGEIFDEFDVEAEPAPPPVPAVLEVDGAEEVMAIQERFGVTLPSGAATIGGLLASLAGRIPASGERFAVGGLEFDVLQASPMRIERLLVRPAPVATTPLAGGPA